MGQIKVTKAPIEGLYVIEPTVHGDGRGYFMETYNQNDMHEAGLVLCQEKVQIKYALLMLSYPAKASALSSNAA